MSEFRMMLCRVRWVTFAILIGIIFLVYSNSFKGDFVYDDIFLIKENPIIKDLSLAPKIFISPMWDSSQSSAQFYRPILILSFALNYAIGKLDPISYHILNVLIHIANVLLVTKLFYLLCRQLPLALGVGLLFGLHPINTEAVAWISGRGDLLSAFFSLGALILYFMALPSFSPGTAKKWPGLYRVLSVVSFFMGLLSKESSVTLIGVLVFYEFIFRPLPRTRGLRLVPYIFVLALYVGVRYMVLGFQSEPFNDFLRNPLSSETVIPRLLTGISIFGKYLTLLLFPLHLSSDYSFNTVEIIRSPWHTSVMLTTLVGIGLVIVWFYSLKRNLVVCWALGSFFVMGALAFINAIIPLGGNIIAERYMYLTVVSFSFVFLWVVASLRQRLPQRVQFAITSILVAVIFGGCFIRTHLRNYDWQDNIRLFKSGIAVNPNSAQLHNNLADSYFNKEMFSLSEYHYRKAISIYPLFASPWIGLGKLSNRNWNSEEAIKYFQQAASMGVNANLYLSFSEAHLNAGQLEEAQKVLEVGLRLEPKNTKVLNNLGVVLARRGEIEKALSLWKQALLIDTFDPLTLLNLATFYENIGQIGQARHYYSRFLMVTGEGEYDIGRQRARAILLRK
jgi:tetratricopeptide (TPR) repeat protein